uniref:Uncharacterized protein n=1 Tax=Moniliophthora roreri TaxID=221103 RepID=A0A0W0FTC5_MONRR
MLFLVTHFIISCSSYYTQLVAILKTIGVGYQVQY